MIRSLVVLFFIACLPQKRDVFIAWSPDYRVKWSDFKNPEKPTAAPQAAAVTASGVSFGYSSQLSSNRLIMFDYHVVAHFYPKKSWYLKEKATDLILEHERLHFDITELYARKFRERIENTTFTVNIDKEIKRIQEQIIKELSDYQNKYDSETQHSINIEAQQQWQETVTKELKTLNHYSY